MRNWIIVLMSLGTILATAAAGTRVEAAPMRDMPSVTSAHAPN